MEKSRFTLDKSSRKYVCPSCGKNRFVRFIDTQTKQFLPPIYGRCDREAACSYFLSPYHDNFASEFFRAENQQHPSQWQPKQQTAAQSPPKPVFIPEVILQATQARPMQQNTFWNYLQNKAPFPFAPADLEKTRKLYRTGTITKGFFSGAITFPFIDRDGNIRAIQVKLFNEGNHTKQTSFIHAILTTHYQKTKQAFPEWLLKYNQQEKKVSCLFGEHLLKEFPNNPVALVEAPKTCIYATLYFGFPEKESENLIWLSTFNLSSLQFEKAEVLKGRKVILFPDLSENGKAFQLWSSKAALFERHIKGTTFTVSDLLERNATETDRLKGFDLADFLIKQDWQQFRPIKNQISEVCSNPQPVQISQQPPAETETLFELERFFNSLTIPDQPIKLKASTITDPARFIYVSFQTLKANEGNPRFNTVFDDLIYLKKHFQTYSHENTPNNFRPD